MKMSLFKHSLARLLCLFVLVAVVAARPGKTRHASTRYNRDQRLVGGSPVDNPNFSFIASLRVMPKELHRCGGFLVSHWHVMTTATCIYSTGTKELHAYLNPLKLDNLGMYVKVNEVATHPNFTLTPHENDVAVLKLVRRVEGPFPIIPDWLEVRNQLDVITFGWGYDKIPGGVGNFTLHMYKLRIIPNGLCSLISKEYYGCDILCGSSPDRFSTSPADVGTPLIHVTEGKIYAVGMLVKETDDMVNAAPYLRLRKFLEWANEQMNETAATEPPTTTTTVTTTTEETTPTTTPIPQETPTPEDEYNEGAEGFGEDYQEQPIKGRSRKRAAFQRQMFRDASRLGKRQISRFG